MASGIGVNELCVDAYLDLKMRRMYRFIIFKVNDENTEIVIDKLEQADPEKPLQESYDEFVACLPADDCRYAVYDLIYETSEGHRSKLCFFSWVPESSTTKMKMIYASSQDALATKLEGVAEIIQVNDNEDIALDEVMGRF